MHQTIGRAAARISLLAAVTVVLAAALQLAPAHAAPLATAPTPVASQQQGYVTAPTAEAYLKANPSRTLPKGWKPSGKTVSSNSSGCGIWHNIAIASWYNADGFGHNIFAWLWGNYDGNGNYCGQMEGEHQVYVPAHGANGTICGYLFPWIAPLKKCTTYPTGGLYGQTVRIWTPVTNAVAAFAETCIPDGKSLCTATEFLYG